MSTNKRKEKISAFLDNEMHRDELMSFSLSSEPEDAEVVRRYQVIGSAMRGEMSEACFVDVSKAVHEALLDQSLVVENLVVATANCGGRPRKTRPGIDIIPNPPTMLPEKPAANPNTATNTGVKSIEIT